ncbi:MAG: DUF418 domain-containing protein [Flavitalea sp.]
MIPFRPTEQQERLSIADALRGLALFAILIANIPYAENADAVYQSRDLIIGSNQTDSFLKAFFHLFIDKKFVPIFSMLFGFGFFIQMKRAEEKGINFRRYFLVRMLLLFVIGCLHAYLLWFGDIIRDYAICGIGLLVIYKWPSRKILYTAIIFAVFLTAIVFILNGALGLQYGFDTTIVREHPLTESYWRYLQINARIDPFRNFIQDSPLTLVFAFGCMLIGFWMAKSGFFHEPEKFRKTTTRLIILGSILGITCSYLFWMITTGEIELTPSLIWLPVIIVAGLLLQSIFYISAFVKLFQLAWFRKLVTFFEPVGRTALTNYILQSVFYLVFFFHCIPGTQLYGKLNLTETYLICILLFCIQVILSRLWLKKFKQGPIEFAWKKVAYFFINKKSDRNTARIKNEVIST